MARLDADLSECVSQNMGLVVTIARDWKNKRLPLDERIQAGTLGLIRAVQKYDPEHATLGTYAAIWIRQAIQRASEKADKNARVASLSVIDYDPPERRRLRTEDSDEVLRVRDAVGRLPPAERQIIIGRYFLGTARGKALLHPLDGKIAPSVLWNPGAVRPLVERSQGPPRGRVRTSPGGVYKSQPKPERSGMQ